MTEHPYWTEMRSKLGAERDLTHFKTLQSVRDVPLYIDDQFTEAYFEEVQGLIDCNPHKEVWTKILKAGEPFDGHHNFSYFKAAIALGGIKTTAFRLKSLHHALLTEQMSRAPIESYNHIVEFGAGIGDTAYTILQKGFSGEYHIIDFPEVYRYAAHYLRDFTNVYYHPDLDFKLPRGRVLFLTTWSLSEVPLEDRLAIGKKIHGYNQLILFQRNFHGIDNFDYFLGDWKKICALRRHSLYPLKFHTHDGGSWYFFAVP